MRTCEWPSLHTAIQKGDGSDHDVKIPFFNLLLTPPKPLMMSLFLKCFSHITVFSFTMKPSLPSWRLIKLHHRAFLGFFIGNLKKCIPELLPSLLYSKLLHSAAAHSLPRLRCFLDLIFLPSFWFILKDWFHGSSENLHERRKGQSERKYSVSLVPV